MKTATKTVRYMGLTMGARAYLRDLLSVEFGVPKARVEFVEINPADAEVVIAAEGLRDVPGLVVLTWREVRDLMRKDGAR